MKSNYFTDLDGCNKDVGLCHF